MSFIKNTLIAGVMSVAAASGALGADAIGFPEASAPAVVPSYNDAQFDWNRFYAGVFGSGQEFSGNWEYGGGIAAGVNAQLDYFLLGGEVAVSALSDGNNNRTYGHVLGRGGLVVTDDLVLYGAAGYGIDLSAAPDEHWLVGGGAEYAITEDLSLRGQYLHGFAANNVSAETNQVSLGLNFHF